MRYKSFVASAAVLALTIISTTFVFLTLTSKRWAVQNYYFNDVEGSEGDGSLDTGPLIWAYRSPFYKCGVPEVYENRTKLVPYCQFYKPYGVNARSCRTAGEMGLAKNQVADSHGLLGTNQECQQVYYAGNLQITACAFLALALLLSLTICLTTLVPQRAASSHEHTRTTHERKDGTTEVRHESPRSRRSKASSGFVVLLLASLYIAAVLQILAQYFGVLGLTVSATPKSQDAVGNQKDPMNFFDADDWAIDVGLSRYATVAWTSALATAAVATVLFRRPTFQKVL